MNARLNIRAAVVVLVVLAAAGGAVAGINRWQVRRTAGGLLDLAAAAEEQGRPDRAARLVERYLQLVPGDADARARLATLQESLARDAKGLAAACEGYEEVLVQDPGRADLRARLARLYARRGMLPETRAQLTALKAEASADPELVFLLAACHNTAGEAGPAEALFRRAVDLDPKSVERAAGLAVFLRRQAAKAGDPAARAAAERQAGEVIDRLVAASPDDPAARLTRAEYRRAVAEGGPDLAAGAAGGGLFAQQVFARTADPAPDLAAAVRLAPANPRVLYAAGQAAADPGESRNHLRAALAADPRLADAYLALAVVEGRDGKPAEAAAVLRRGAAQLPGNPAILITLAGVLIDARDFPEAERVLAEIGRWKAAPERAALLRGRLRMAEGKWQEAADALEAARPGLTAASAGLAAEADVLIGRCREQLGQEEPALAAYRRAAGYVPAPDDRAGVARLADAQAGVAKLLVRSGRLGEAVDHYRRLAEAPGATPEAKLTYARLRTAQYLAGPPAGRRPADLDPLFADLAAKAPDAPDVVLLRAEVLVADRQLDAAAGLLREALARKPDGLEFGLPLARLLDRQGKPAEAWAVLDALAAKAKDGAAVPLARLDLLPAADDPRAAAAVADVERRIGAAADPDEKARLADGLAAASARWGKPDEARRRWEEVAGLRPKDLAVRFRLLDLAFQSGDRARVDAAVEAVRRADGPGGAQTQYAEGLAVVSRTAATPAELADARLHLTASAALRPTWPFPVGMLGLALDREGKPDEALAAYLRAVDLGDRRPVVIRRAVQLLYDRRRIDEADRLVQKLGPAESLSPELTRLAADVSLANNQLDRAVALAGAAVAADSKEPVDHLWQAQVLAGAGKTDEAVAALRRATAVAGGKGGPWVALVRTLLQAGRKDEAEKVIAGLGEKLTGPELTLTQAQCQELAGRGERAEALYKEAAGARPGDPAAVRMLAGYYERQGNLPAAVPALRGLLAASPPPPADDQAWTRRVLAAALARTGEYKDFREGLGLIDQNLAARPGNPADLVAKAQVLATRLVHRRDAVAVLEGLQKQGPLVPAAQFVYGQLLADTGPWAAARAVLLDALARDGDNPAYLRAFVDRLLKNDQAGEAGAWLDRLDRLAPGDPEGARLRATWLARRGRGAEAADLVAGLANPPAGGPKEADPLARVRAAAGVAESAGQAAGAGGADLLDQAERLHRRVAGAGGPADHLALAAYLGRRGRAEEAVQVCQKATAADALAVAEVLVGIGYGPADLTPTDLDRIGGELTRALDRTKVPGPAGMMRGVWAARRGDYRAAADAFRAAAEAGGGPAALNNLAYMLVLSGSPAGEAETVLQKVVDQVGLSPEVLDTRGALRLGAGRVAEAVADLEQAVDQEPTAARLVHLAAAYEKAGRKDDAKRALARADGLKGDGSLVLPAERAEYLRLSDASRKSP